MNRICPKCGFQSKNTDEFLGPFCKKCVSFNVDFKNIIKIPKCRDCGLLNLNEKWKKIDKKDIVLKIKKNIKGKKYHFEIDLKKNKIYFFKTIENEKIKKEFDFEIVYSNSLCLNCTKKHGNYFEGIVQVRGKIENKKTKRLIEIFKKEQIISKISELKQGIDIYIINKNSVASILSALKIPFTKSEKLATEKKGKRLYRTTFCIRF